MYGQLQQLPYLPTLISFLYIHLDDGTLLRLDTFFLHEAIL